MASITDNLYLGIENCYARLPTFDDAKAIVTYFKANREFLTPWEPTRPDSFFTLKDWQQRLFQLAKLQQHGLAFYFLLFANEPDEVVGIISFSHISYYPAFTANVGYSLAKHAQSRGIMRKALQATCQLLFNELNLHRITAAYMPRNLRSARLLNAVGFIKEGQAKDYLLINGKWEDHILTSLTNEHWQKC